MRTHLHTEVLITEQKEDTVRPFLHEIDTNAEWWFLLVALWTHIANAPLRRDRTGDRIIRWANTDSNIYLMFTKPDFCADTEKLMCAELTESQRRLISDSDRDLILVTAGGMTSVIADPCVRTIELSGLRTWVYTLPKQAAVDILRLLCGIETEITRRVADVEQVVVIADLTLSHIFIFGSVGPRAVSYNHLTLPTKRIV